jgi:hypothetical protein
MASPPGAASMKLLSHSGGKGRHGTGRTKDVPGFDRLAGSLAFTADLSGIARELVTRELSGPNRHESLMNSGLERISHACHPLPVTRSSLTRCFASTAASH